MKAMSSGVGITVVLSCKRHPGPGQLPEPPSMSPETLALSHTLAAGQRWGPGSFPPPPAAKPHRSHCSGKAPAWKNRVAAPAADVSVG